MRLIGYFTNVFLETLTNSAPYDQYLPKVEKKNLTEDEINTIEDLGQPDNDLDLEILMLDSSIFVSERPYLTERFLEM